MRFQLPTARTMDEIQAGLEESAARNNFGILTVHDLRQTLENKDVPLDME